MHVLIRDGAVEQYPYSPAQLRRDNPQVSFPQDMTDELLVDYGVFAVTPAARPDYNPITHRLVELPPRLDGGAWVQGFDVQPLPPDVVAEQQAAANAAMRDSIVRQTQDRLDAFAGTRGYAGILSLCTYATSTVPKFRDEGQYGVVARDATWAALYAMLADVEAGTRPVPSSFAEIEPELPPLTWPAET